MSALGTVASLAFDYALVAPFAPVWWLKTPWGKRHLAREMERAQALDALAGRNLEQRSNAASERDDMLSLGGGSVRAFLSTHFHPDAWLRPWRHYARVVEREAAWKYYRICSAEYGTVLREASEAWRDANLALAHARTVVLIDPKEGPKVQAVVDHFTRRAQKATKKAGR